MWYPVAKWVEQNGFHIHRSQLPNLPKCTNYQPVFAIPPYDDFNLTSQQSLFHGERRFFVMHCIPILVLELEQDFIQSIHFSVMDLNSAKFTVLFVINNIRNKNSLNQIWYLIRQNFWQTGCLEIMVFI